jgi:hypothetical protein
MIPKTSLHRRTAHIADPVHLKKSGKIIISTCGLHKTNKWATTRKILHKIWGIFYLPFSFNVRKSKNLETSISVLFFFFFCFLTREISSEIQIQNQKLEIEEFLEAF